MEKTVKFALLVATALSLFSAIFPWFFETAFTVGPLKVSLRGMGNAYAVLCALIGFGILFFSSFREKLYRKAQFFDALPPQIHKILILTFTTLLALPLISYKLRAHTALGTHAHDLGFFSNICWNLAQGNGFYSSLYARDFLGVHVNWILWPLSFFYKGGGDARVLLVAQAVFVTAAIPFLWATVHRITHSFSLGMLASLLYISSPFVGHHLGNDFHPDSWLLPCLIGVVWAWHLKKPGLMILLGALSLLAKEDASVALCGFGLFLLFKKEWRFWGGALIVMGLGVFLFHTKVIIPRHIEGRSESLLFSRYPLLGNSYQEWISNLFFKPSVYLKAVLYDPAKYYRLLTLFFPALCLTFWAPSYLIPIGVSVLPHLLSQAGPQLQLADIYAMPSQPFIFIGAAYGGLRLLKNKVIREKSFILLGSLFLVAGIGIRNTPRFYRTVAKQKRVAFQELKKQLLPHVSVAAQQNLLPHVASRRGIQLFPLGIATPELQSSYDPKPDYIIGDRVGNVYPYNEQDLKKALSEVEQDPAYKIMFEREGLVLFKKIEENN